MKITRIFPVAFCAAVILLLGACGSKEQKKEVVDDVRTPVMVLTSEDTVTVTNLTKEFLENLKANRLDEAMGMLHYMDKDKKLVDLPKDLADKQRKVFTMFPVLSYKIDSVIFYSETDSQVKYTIQFFEKEEGDNRPNTTSFFIKPMRVDRKWYLTMADSNSDNIGHSKIKN